MPGLGPVLIARLVRHFGSARAVLEAPAHRLRGVKGIGDARADAVERARGALDELVDREVAELERHGASLIALGDPAYPALLAHIDDPPPLLYVRGTLRPRDLDRAMLAIVGSRKCSHYGMEQAGRFASALAQAGVTIVSGGARGVDTTAHRGALEAGGRTVAVMGCGLARMYPPENEALFERIAEQGCLVSELPLHTAPTAENFPARNRIISGMSHGTLVVEAGRRSGSLITARLAAEDHGREVFAIPGRVDSPHSAGSLELLKSGGAALVTEPGDILAALERATTFDVEPPVAATGESDNGLFGRRGPARERVAEAGSERGAPVETDEVTRRILDALDGPLTADQLAARADLPAHELRSRLTMLEIQRRVRRAGTMIERVR